MIIGNMTGAHQMLPDPDWKDQRGARDRTTGGNNNDCDNQDGDMPSWIFKRSPTEGNLRRKTQRTSQPSQEE